MKIAFYDDNLATIKAFRKQHPHIKSFFVSNKQRNPILKNNAKFYYPLLFSQMYPNNKYAQFLVNDSHLTASPGKTAPTNVCESLCRFADVGSGLTLAEIKTLLTHRFDVILFDWDLTLSVCNGIMLPDDPKSNYTEVAEFYAGTLERFNALRAMFTELRRRGTKVYILSDNGMAQKPKLPVEEGQTSLFDSFLLILQQLDGEIRKDDIVYGNNNKVETMKTSVLSQYCRKRKTKKHKKITLRTAKSR
jgi:hypothetical protein